MSQIIRKYEKWNNGKRLHVASFVGGTPSVQFTIGREYACLSENQILDLISVLARRLLGTPKWSATGCSSEEALILQNGRKGGKEE